MRWFSRWGALLGCTLALPALQFGLVIDDYFIASRVRAPDGIRWRGLLDAFSFVPRDGLPAMRELGEMPWWSDPELTLSFLRPLSALTHAVDFSCLPPWCMHLESIACLLALNLAVAAWYRRLLGPEHGLALALYVVAPGHVFAASWLANRNGLLAACFAVWTLLHYDRDRTLKRTQWRTLMALALALLSGELGVSALALLIAHAACLDASPWRTRLRALAPSITLTVAWMVVHTSLGYGARGSALYVSPLDAPWRYAMTVLEHAPLLLFAQWGVPAVSLALMLSRTAVWVAVLVSLLCLGAWSPRLVGVLRTDSRARFCALACLLTLLPVCTTAVHDRLLLVADVAGLALVALAVQVRASRPLRAWLHVRLALSVLLALGYAASLQQHVDLAEKPFDRILRAAAVSDQSVVFVNSPIAFYSIQLRWLRAHQGGPVPRRLRTLVPGIHPLTLQRLDERTLRISADGGLFQPLGTRRNTTSQPQASPYYLAQLLNQFAREAWSYRAHDRVTLEDLQVEIEQATDDGYPERVTFHFTDNLERYVFLRWEDDRYLPMRLPAVGEQVELAAAR